MEQYIGKKLKRFQKDIINIEKNSNVNDINEIIKMLEEAIKNASNEYFQCNDVEIKESIKDNLLRCYNLLYFYQSKKNGINRTYLLNSDIEKIPSIYTINQSPERFDIDIELISNINIEEGLTIEQAEELLKWSANNTRDNMQELKKRNPFIMSNNINQNVYGNDSLSGICGFSQFSTLFPLQQMGLKITINNVGAINGGRHAYGTVTIPIKTEEGIILKRFIIDCTYRQFFTLPYNCVARFINSEPDIGFYIENDLSLKEFAIELMKKGFVEANDENLEKYLKPFFARYFEVKNISKLDEEFNKLNIIEILENNQEEFDYTEQEFIDWGLNLKIPGNDRKM